MSDRPYSPAAENNKGPILAVLKHHLVRPGQLLEVGAGTGQHAAWLAPRLPHLQWYPTDVPANLAGITRWVEGRSPNLHLPQALDVAGSWPPMTIDYLFTANTFHIMSEALVQRCIEHGCHHLRTDGLFLVYGPFNYRGRFTSQSNQRFDNWLRLHDPEQGIRDQEWVAAEFAQYGYRLLADHAMPANNRLLVFKGSGVPRRPA